MYAKFFKRLLDICCSLLALLVLSPLLVALTATGAVLMRGNPFFTQPRPGKGEKIFKLVKFRTMTNQRDKAGNLLPDDVRLTRPLGVRSVDRTLVSPRSRQHDLLRQVAYGSHAYGKFLRSTSLDFLLGGPALPRRHALFYGPASRLRHPAALVKRSQAPLGVIPALEPESSLAAPVSALACNDRCRETLEEAA